MNKITIMTLIVAALYAVDAKAQNQNDQSPVQGRIGLPTDGQRAYIYGPNGYRTGTVEPGISGSYSVYGNNGYRTGTIVTVPGTAQPKGIAPAPSGGRK